ncbi:SRPBCC family protein [Dongia soli]|uniref:SRPBCC family protein n=1 Tax=Dongia soli TaxID=600628 RepID=A0ABU5EE27_9PROT|nr:SRPBCC family protein [Dongia soli]MDY0884581.1 SRPBCC family protein [Dongia soli]
MGYARESSPRQDRRRGSTQAGNRGKGLGNVGIAVALAGAAALGVIGVQALRRSSKMRVGGMSGATAGASAHGPEVERSLTIEKSVDELYRRWRDPQNFQKIIGHFAEVESLGDGRARWSAPAPLGEWYMRQVEDRPDELMRWEAEEASAPLQESSVRFRPAKGKQGSVVTVHMRLNPPGGVLGRAAAKIMHNVIPAEIASKMLHYFKSLVLTGEVPTTDRQPSARRDPDRRDY